MQAYDRYHPYIIIIIRVLGSVCAEPNCLLNQSGGDSRGEREGEREGGREVEKVHMHAREK